jgi:MFS superfamily sulfate permease-like transporter
LASHQRLRFISNARRDLKASVTVFFVALPLCLGIALASGAPVSSGFVAGIVGGLVVSLVSRSPLSVSGPAAGLSALAAAALVALGDLRLFFLAVSLAGVFQMLLGFLRLGGFTWFIPSSVIKGMLAAIGILLMAKQVPLLFGYDAPDFWSAELVNLFSLRHGFRNVDNLFRHVSAGVAVITACSFAVLIAWRRFLAVRLPYIPASFVTVLAAVLLASFFEGRPGWALQPSQRVSLPPLWEFRLPGHDPAVLLATPGVWRYAVIFCLVATLESLLSIEAIDKLDPYNRITPQNRELVAQGAGNLLSGLLGGIPVTAVIVRSAANAEAGARTRLSAFLHGAWLLAALLVAVPLINRIPFCVLAVLLVRTGYNLARPSMMRGIYRQGREQFLPFAVTVGAILLTDLLMGVAIGLVYALYFIVKHTYRAGFTVSEEPTAGGVSVRIELALNVSFLNKKKIAGLLDRIPPGSSVTVDGGRSVYIDNDVREIIDNFRAKARQKGIAFEVRGVPAAQTLRLH